VAALTAFDHSNIFHSALARLRDKVEYSTLPVHLLPAGFTLGELQSVYERILGRRLDKSAFRKRVAEADFVEPVSGRDATRQQSTRSSLSTEEGALDHLLRPNDLNRGQLSLWFIGQWQASRKGCLRGGFSG